MIPAELLFPAPGLPKGHVLLGYDANGHCPMLAEGGCSIFASCRCPRTWPMAVLAVRVHEAFLQHDAPAGQTAATTPSIGTVEAEVVRATPPDTT